MMTIETLDTIAGNAREMIDSTRARLGADDLTGRQRLELRVDLEELGALVERVARWREELVAA